MREVVDSNDRRNSRRPSSYAMDGLPAAGLFQQDGKKQQSRRKRLERYLVTSSTGLALDLVNTLLSLLACVMYVWESYEDEQEWFEDVELLLCVLFGADYVLRVYLSECRVALCLSPPMMVDLLTIVPAIIQSFVSNVSFLNFFRFLRVLRILRIIRIQRMFAYLDSEVKQQLFKMILTIVSIVFLASGLVHLVEMNGNRSEPLAFHEVLYFIIVTITTVGYGDIHPETGWGMLIVSLMICATVVLVPRQTNELIRLMGLQSIYATKRYRAAEGSHVIVCGAVNQKGTEKFFWELWHEDHNVFEVHHAVVLDSGMPSGEISAVMQDPRYALFITYLDGTVLNPKDLARASAETAKACFVLANKFCRDPNTEDATTILRALAIKRYVSELGGAILTCIQLQSPENQTHFACGRFVGSLGGAAKRRTRDLVKQEDLREDPVRQDGETGSAGVGAMRARGPRQTVMSLMSPTNQKREDGARYQSIAQESGDVVVCISEMKLALLAKACLCPGLTTLVANLVGSSSSETSEGNWMEEYRSGSDHEVYYVPLSQGFEGLTFSRVVMIVFEICGGVLMGLEISAKESSRIVLNPGSFVIPSVARYNIKAFVIAKDHAQAIAVSTYVDTSSRGGATADKGKGKSSSFTAVKPRRVVVPVNTPQVGVEPDSPSIHTARSSRVDSTELQELEEGEEEGSDDSSSSALTSTTATTTYQSGGVPGQRRSASGVSVKAAAVTRNKLSPRRSTSDSRGSRGASMTLGGSPRSPGSPGTTAPTASRWWQLRNANRRDLDPELEAMQAQYYMLDAPRKLQQAVVEYVDPTQFHKHMGSLDLSLLCPEHIILSGNVNHLLYFVRPLRDRHLSKIRPIVIFHKHLIDEHTWGKISRFPLLFFVQGSALEREDLLRAGAEFAARAVLLAPSAEAIDVGQAEAQVLVDADSIFAYQGLKQLNRDIIVVSEMVNTTNISYLNMDPGTRPSPHSARHYSLAPVYCSGEAYTSNVNDLLMAQSFYNPRIVKLIKQLVAGEDSADVSAWGKGATELAELHDSHVFQIPVPDALVNATWLEVMHDLTAQHMIPLGIVRGVINLIGSGTRGNNLPYVLTNPGQKTVIERFDKIFVLSQVQPEDAEVDTQRKGLADLMVNVTRVARNRHLTQDKRSDADRAADRVLETVRALHNASAAKSDRLYEQMQTRMTAMEKEVGQLRRRTTTSTDTWSRHSSLRSQPADEDPPSPESGSPPPGGPYYSPSPRSPRVTGPPLDVSQLLPARSGRPL